MADTPRPYLVFPVPMRVDAGESERLALRQSFARQSFAELVTHIDPSQVAEYWSGVEVPHRVFYAYEEVLAPFKDDPLDPKTVLAAFLRLASHLTDGEVTDYRLPITPELRQRFLSAFAQTTQTAHIRQEQVEAQRETLDQTLVRQADGVMFALPEGEKAMAQQLFCRLVRLGREEEGRGYFPIRFPLGELAEAELAVIDQLVRGGLVTIASASSGYQSVGFSDPRLPALWASLRGWLESDREYLLWRQQLRTYLADWDRSGNDKGAFLSGTLLAEARLWLRQREKDLTSVERAYIAASEQNAAQAQAPAVAPLPLPSFETARGGVDQMDRWLTAKARTAAEGVAPAKAAAPSRPLRADVAAMAISTLAIDGDSPAKVASAFAARSSAIRVVIAIAFAFAFGSWWWLAARAHAPQIVAPQPSSSVSIALPVSSSEVSTAQKQQADEQIALGDQALTSGDVELAASRYQRALEIDSSRPEAALKLGRANEAKGDLNGAASAYERAMMIAPTSSTPWIERGATRALQGRYAEALADCSRAIELDKTVPRAWFNRGVAHENLNQPEAATEDYSSAIALKPDVAALLARARLTESSHRAQALADYQSVLGLAPNAADAQLATERIRLLSPKALANAGPRIFVQYSSASDLSRVNDLRSALSGAFKLTVGPAQLAASGTSGSVRYFFASDEELANKVLATSQLALAKQGARVELKLMRLDAKNFPSAEAGTVELWLPSLSTPQPSRPDFIQRAPVKDLSENPY